MRPTLNLSPFFTYLHVILLVSGWLSLGWVSIISISTVDILAEKPRRLPFRLQWYVAMPCILQQQLVHCIYSVITVHVALLNSFSLTLTCSEIIGGWGMVGSFWNARKRHLAYIKCKKTLWRPGLCPDPAGGAYSAPITPGWLGWSSLPPPQEPHPALGLSGLGVPPFRLRLPHPNFQIPKTKILVTCLVPLETGIKQSNVIYLLNSLMTS